MSKEAMDMLTMLLASCERLQAEAKHGPIVWDTNKPTFFYLERNMGWARDVIAALDTNTGD